MRPSRNLIYLFCGWFLLALASAFMPTLEGPLLALSIAIAVALPLDLLLLRGEPTISIERHVAHNLPQGAWSKVKLKVQHSGRRRYRMTLFDHYPEEAEIDGLPHSLTLAPQQHATVSYRLRPIRRGDAHFSAVEVELISQLGLWRRYRLFPVSDAVKVYPNFSEVTKFGLLSSDNQLGQIGVRKRRQRGEGLEFHQLREYHQGDNLRQIDWKATSRLRKLISREYQQERDQQLIFMLDCSRRMRSEDDHTNHFDQALNAMLLLSYAALRQGDSVGFITFGGQQRYFAPQKGQQAVNQILNKVYDLETTNHTADYAVAARELLVRQRKRSLVVVLTNLRDEDQDELHTMLQLLRSRHLVMIANLRESILDQISLTPVHDFEQALRYCANEEYQSCRKQTHGLVSRLGALALDVTASQLPVSLVNHYLDIKRRGIL